MMSLIETRNRHFLEACRRVMRNLPAGEEINITKVAMTAALSPAPHYYCTFMYALRMLRVLRHGRLALRRDRRLALWEELNVKCTAYMSRTGCKLPEALGYILASESASQYFIAPATALRLVQRLRAASAAARS
ncbi:MAG: hypothetical protein J6L68_02795 [Muribaculaceae bacterium]|nr:hypothetical protein [Muribaculaceae bacterium]